MVEKVTKYIIEQYNVLPEHPWVKYPDNMAFKAAGTDKWFALIMPVARKSLGLDGIDEMYIINVKAPTDYISFISGTKGYMSGYHMNKRHWLTVFLDGSVPFDQICDRIDESHHLVTNTPAKRIYDAVRRIPLGKVATYGQIAQMAGDKNMARAVGNALHKNPDPSTIPCHRVVNAKGELSGAFAFGGAGEQARRLMEEGVEVINDRVDLTRFQYH